MRTITTTKNRTRATEHADVAQEVSKGTIAVISAVPGLIGLWAAACFVGGLINAGGPLGMARSWFQAITGM